VGTTASALENTPREARAFIGCLTRAAKHSEDPFRSTAAVLAAVELLTGPLRPDPLAETTPVRFHMVSALNGSPLVPGPSDDDPRSVDKLAGNQVHNFGAFLSAQWRLNDWTWGRLDAAGSLVDVLLHDLRPDGDAAASLRNRLGLAAGAPIPAIRDECVRRLHDEVLRAELPLLATVDDRPPPPDRLDDVAPLGPRAALDTTKLQRIGAERVRDVVMRGGRRVPDAGRLVRVAALIVADGVAQGVRHQPKDWARWAGRMAASRADAVKSAVSGRKSG
jgi:hypothetical protein